MEEQHYTEVNLREAERRLAISQRMMAEFPYVTRYQVEVDTYQEDVRYYRAQLAKLKAAPANVT